MKGIVLAGGTGTRLYPATRCISKQLLPIYDKPMVYYPIVNLMEAGIRDILIITTSHEQHLFKELLGNGQQWGVRFDYIAQENPRGIADAFIVGEDFINNEPVCLILGDNLLYGHGLCDRLRHCSQLTKGATVFAYYVNHPERYGVVTLDHNGAPLEIIEKPQNPQSNYAVIGVYFYDAHVVSIAKQLTPSARGELEITDISNEYLRRGELNVETLDRGIAWLDTGTHQALLQAAHFIEVLEERQSLKIGCPEEIAWRMQYIDDKQLRNLAKPLMNSGYGNYLLRLLDSSNTFKLETEAL